MYLKSSQVNKWTFMFSSYSPAFYAQNKIRTREWKELLLMMTTQVWSSLTAKRSRTWGYNRNKLGLCLANFHMSVAVTKKKKKLYRAKCPILPEVLRCWFHYRETIRIISTTSHVRDARPSSPRFQREASLCVAVPEEQRYPRKNGGGYGYT